MIPFPKKYSLPADYVELGEVPVHTVPINVCPNCGKNNPTLCIVHDYIWKEIAKNGVLCLHCMERALGRPIRLKDLKRCGITNEMMVGAIIALREEGVEIPEKLIKRM